MKNPPALLILLLCVGIGLTTQLPAAAQGKNAASQSGWKRIDFNERSDLKTVIKMYPILKDPIEETQRDYESQPSNLRATLFRVQIAVARSEKGNLDLLFLYVRDPLYCGSHGCRLIAYADEGNGYKEAGRLVALPVVYRSSEGSRVSLLFCGSLEGGAKWDLRNHALVFIGRGTCPAIMPHS